MQQQQQKKMFTFVSLIIHKLLAAFKKLYYVTDNYSIKYKK
jgi:hypothetical protein